VKRNGETILSWKYDEPVLFYWFSLAAAFGDVTWSLNCDPEGEFMEHCILITINIKNLKIPPY
jgi:hypothetical protein